MKRFTRKLPILVIAGTVVGLLAYGFRPVPVDVDVATVERGSFDITVNDDGETRIREKYIVSAPVAGNLQRIELHAGDPVEHGQTILAQLEPGDPTLLDARSEAQAEARVSAAEAAKELASARLTRANEAHDLAEDDFKRATALLQKKAISRSDYDRVDHQLQMAKADVRSGEFAVRVANFEAELARAALVRTRDDFKAEEPLKPGESLHDAVPTTAFTIVSPVSGRVLRVFNEDAGIVAQGTRIMELGDPRDLEMKIDVLSSEAVRIKPGARVFVDHWGGDETLEGIVRVVEPAAFVKVSALGVEEHRVNVIADFHRLFECKTALGDGFRIEARIVVESATNVVKVPAGVVFRHGDGWAAYEIVEGRARLQRVKIGRSNGLQTEILEGLSPKDVVVLHPTDQVQDSVRVRTSG